MKKGLFKKIAGHALSLGSGLIGKSNPVVGLVIGAVKQVKENIKEGRKTEVGGEGNVDWAKMIGAIISGLIILFGLYKFFSGVITMDELNEIVKISGKIN